MFKKLAIALFAIFLIPTISLAGEIRESLISTEASINREVTPDTAKIRFSVETSGLNLADLKAKNDKIVSEAITAIRAKLTPDEQVKTVSFNVRNIYSYKDKIRVFQKYEVQNSFEVKLKDLEKISQIINTAMEHGVKNVSNIGFSVENSENICNEMMAEAVKIAKNRVQYVANAAGTTLDKVKSINPYCSLSASHVQQKVLNAYANRAMGSMADSSVATESIEPGTINARASVNMFYYLK